MFDKVVGDLSGKVLSLIKMLTSQKFPTPRPDTKPPSGRARFPFFFLYFSFFADSAPIGLCVTSSQTPTPPTPFSFDSNTAVERVQLVVTPKPQSSAVSETTTGTDSYSQESKSMHEVFTFRLTPLCFVYTCSIFCAVRSLFCNLRSWTNTLFTSRSMTLTLKSSKPPSVNLASMI